MVHKVPKVSSVPKVLRVPKVAKLSKVSVWRKGACSTKTCDGWLVEFHRPARRQNGPADQLAKKQEKKEK